MLLSISLNITHTVSDESGDSHHSIKHKKFNEQELDYLAEFRERWNDVVNFPAVNLTTAQWSWFDSLSSSKTFDDEDSSRGLQQRRKRATNDRYTVTSNNMNECFTPNKNYLYNKKGMKVNNL